MLQLFNDSNTTFAIVSEDSRLKLWDVLTQSVRQEYVTKDHLSKKYTAIAWSTKSPWDKKKSKRGDAQGLGVIALGSAQGNIVIWDLTKGEVVQGFNSEETRHNGSINDIAFNSSGTVLYSCSNEKYVVEWDVKSGKKLRRFRVGKEGASRLAVSSDDSVLATASSGIILWDLASGEKSVKLTSGHSSTVSCLAFSPCNGFLFSSARGGRFINCFNSTDGSTEPLINFAIESTPRHIFSVIKKKKNKSTCFLGAVSDVDRVFLWKHNIAKEETATPVQPVSSSPSGSHILHAAFDGYKDGSLNVVQGSAVKPEFERIQFMDEKQNIVETIAKGKDLSNLITSEEPVSKKPKNDSVQPNKVHVVALADRALNVTMADGADHGNLEDDDDDGNELTLSERVEALRENIEQGLVDDFAEDVLEIEEKALAKASASKLVDSKNQSSSLVTVLEQALQSKDNAMLEYCLQISDVVVVDATIRRLPASRVLPFLTTVVGKFERRPTRGSILCIWIRSILKNHTSYLMAVPDLVSNLSSLYQTLEARLRVFQSLYKLSGRLDLVLNQIAHREEAMQTVNKDVAHVYTEGEEVEAEDPIPEDAMEEDDDEDEDA